MNQPARFAIARVGPRDNWFNLEVSFLPEPVRPFDQAYAEVLAATRARYSTPRATIREELAALRGMIPPEKGADPFAKLKARQDKQRKEEAPVATAEPPADEAPPEETIEPDVQADAAATKAETVASGVPAEPRVPVDSETEDEDSDEVRRDPNAESIKNEVIQAAGGWGYSHQTEKSVNQGTGRVDIVLTIGSVVVACEISATTSARHEVGNLTKCLQAGFERIVYVCDATHRRRRTEEHLKKV